MLSMRLETLTVLPQMSYCGLRAPITPATTGPMFRPGGGRGQGQRVTAPPPATGARVWGRVCEGKRGAQRRGGKG